MSTGIFRLERPAASKSRKHVTTACLPCRTAKSKVRAISLTVCTVVTGESSAMVNHHARNALGKVDNATMDSSLMYVC